MARVGVGKKASDEGHRQNTRVPEPPKDDMQYGGGECATEPQPPVPFVPAVAEKVDIAANQTDLADWTETFAPELEKQAADEWEFKERGGIVRPADRPTVWYAPDGVWEYRASSIGECIRAMVAARKGMTPADSPEFLQKPFAEGHAGEPVMLQMLRDRGYGVFGQQDPVSIQVAGKNARIWGHVDGKTTVGKLGVPPGSKGADQLAVIECKAFGPDYYKLFKKGGLAAFPGYSMQVAALCHGLGVDACLFVVGRKDADGVVQDIDIEFVPKPPVGIGRLIAKVVKVERLADETGMPDCDPERFPCPFYFLHDAKSKVGGDGAVEIDDGEMRRAVESHAYWAESERNAKAGKAAAQDKIRELAEAQGIDLEGGKYVVVDNDGKRYTFSQVVREMPESLHKASTQRFVQVKVVGPDAGQG